MNAGVEGAELIAKFAKQLAGGKVTKITPSCRKRRKRTLVYWSVFPNT